MTNKPPTMRDVAQLANVSIQTVSCVINNTGNISSSTRTRVQEAIDQLNYRRDPIARSMRTRQTRLIALLILDITNPVLSVIASHVEAAAYERDYHVLLYNIGQDARRQQTQVEMVSERRVDGMIVVNSMTRQLVVSSENKEAIPMVLIDSMDLPSIPSVSADNILGGYLATQHLIELGHKRIAHLSGAPSLEVARHRVQGYQQALADYGLKYEHIIPPLNNRWDYRSGYQGALELLNNRERPTAIFAAGDQMAIGAYRALNEVNIRIPEDMSVVGFDDIEAVRYATPALTTIRQPFDQIAESALNLLLDILDGNIPSTQRINLKPQLIVRESTRRLD